MSVSSPLRVPVTVGLNSTPRVQILLAGIVVPQGKLPPVAVMKSPLAVTPVMGSAAGMLLVTVTIFTALVPPTETVPKDSEVGESVTASIPVPASFCTSVVTDAFEITVTPPMAEPKTVGV